MDVLCWYLHTQSRHSINKPEYDANTKQVHASHQAQKDCSDKSKSLEKKAVVSVGTSTQNVLTHQKTNNKPTKLKQINKQIISR